MTKKAFEAGDKVSWNSAQGTVKGTVKKTLTAPTNIKTHHIAASEDKPQLLVESASTGQEAAHKPGALKRIKKAPSP